MKVNQWFDLTYCSNIHPGEDWKIHWSHLKENIPVIKSRLAPEEEFGLGLRIGNRASLDLSNNQLLQSFKKWLNENNLYVFTLNGFPYGPFHRQMVKEAVHSPDWTTRERLNYTQRLFLILKELMPLGREGSISTSPIGYTHDYVGKKSEALKKGAINLVEIVKFLSNMEKEGYCFHLDLEPEPDGLLENSEDVIVFFNDYLLPAAKKEFANESLGKVDEIYKFIRICYDVCHFAVVFENQEEALNKITKEGIKIGKIQLSSAVKINLAKQQLNEEKAIEKLLNFDETVYLHQVAARKNDGEILRYADLPLLKQRNRANGIQELRSHFHVPVFLEEYEDLSSTQNEIITVLNYTCKHKICKHLEVETYTWDVLPKSLQINIASSIERELQWIISKLL